jgi:RNA polymerase sigma factor (sigma-70 family)
MAMDAPTETPTEHLRRVLATHGPALQRLACSWTRRPSDRDDLLQDIAVALLQALPRFRGECPERAFVWRVAHNRALALAAKRRRAGQREADEPPEDHPSTLLSPHDVAEQRERHALLQRALRLLRDEQRVLVTLALEGLTLDEIATVMGGSANAVGVRLHRARAALSAHLASMDHRASGELERT